MSSHISNCHIYPRPTDDIFKGGLTLDAYLIAPLELFTEWQLRDLLEKHKKTYAIQESEEPKL